MRTRGGVLIVLLLATVAVAPAAAASTPEIPVVIDGVGAAHGFGLAMDGVQGQARAGWDHDRILSLFYPGTATGHAGGTIRVGLAEVGATTLTLPSGGMVSDAPRGARAGAGFPRTLAAGARISLRTTPGGITGLSQPSTKTVAAAVPTPKPKPTPGRLLPTAPPIAKPKPKPTPRRTPTPASTAPKHGPALRSVWIWGTGTPALVDVGATGHRYRGAISVTRIGGALSVVNHVDLETYVAGIAEEKGQGWPDEGMKTLAIAARSLAAATMTWYSSDRRNGYDICPSANCQVYLGYDGEEPAMQRATSETSGRIRTYNGRAILAMYHGNGGGQTESYARAIDNGTDPYPYLRSVKYPFAKPSHWQLRTTLPAIEATLRAKNIGVPGALQRIEIVKRGESPRVLRMKLTGTDGTSEISGNSFATALDLRSTWFDLSNGKRPAAVVTGSMYPTSVDTGVYGQAAGVPVRAAHAWWTGLLVAAIALAVLALAAGLLEDGALEPLALGLSGMRGPRLRSGDATG